MSRTYRRKHDKAPYWVTRDYVRITDMPGYWGWKWVPLNEKGLKKEVAKWHSDAGWHSDYNSCPKWWNKLYHIQPARTESKRLQKKVLELVDYEDAPEFPLWPNGVEYYW